MKAMLNISATRRIAAAFALAPMLAGVLAGCGGPGQGVTPVPAPRPTGHHAACDVRHLEILVDPSAVRPGVPGGSYLPINFVNQSRTACEIKGYPHVVAMTGTGLHNAVASHLHVRGLGRPLLLPPDYTAHTWLLIANAPSGKRAGCRAFSATGLRVSPPGTGGFAWVNWPLRICVPPNTAALSVQAVQQGLANATTFP